MAIRDRESHTTANPRVRLAVAEHEHVHAGCRKLAEYLRGARRRDQLSMSADVLPALRMLQGRVIMHIQHAGGSARKDEFLYIAAADCAADAVSSCWYSRDRPQITDTPWQVAELAAARDIPDPDGFVFASDVEYAAPPRAMRGDA